MKYVLIVVVFAASASLYAAFGRAEVEHAPVPDESNGQQKIASVTELLSGLEARLAEDPDDGKGWLLLAKSYEHLRRIDDAISAYEKASALGVTDEQLLYRLMSRASGWDAQ